ncbi:MAG: metallophosphoesterase [Leptospirales bacterium]|nr:metallophosphoesterase [Leptospirales bacterium]
MSFYQVFLSAISIASGIAALAFAFSLRRRRPRLAAGIILLTVAALAPPLIFLGGGNWPLADDGLAAQLHLLTMAILCSFPFLAFVALGQRLLRSNVSDERRPESLQAASDEHGMNRRQMLQRSAAIAVAALDFAPVYGIAAALGAMSFGSNHPITTDLSLRLPDASEDLRGLRMVQISDLHFGPAIGEAHVRLWLSYLREHATGDALLLTGDLVDADNRALPLCAAFLNRLHELYPAGIYAVTGNHDYYDSASELRRILSRAGVRFLSAQHTVLKRGKGQLQIAGLEYGSRPYEAVRLLSALRPDQPSILLNHVPANFTWLQHLPFSLVLSGHTHGGHLRTARGPQGRSLLLPGAEFVAGWYERGLTRMYVNSGLGHSFPMRIHCPPEATRITIV